MKGDILQCKLCYKTFTDTFIDIQDGIVQQCPFCMHCKHWNLTKQKREQNPIRKNRDIQGKYIYRLNRYIKMNGYEELIEHGRKLCDMERMAIRDKIIKWSEKNE